MDLSRKLSPDFYQRDTVTVARELLGCYLVRVVDGAKRVGKIVEVEAYLGPQDLAAHSSKGLTERTRVMFGPAGHVYVYLIYGIYFCMNIVTEGGGRGCAVLLRALEPVLNLEVKTSGPGLLCRAMQIDKRFYGHDLQSGDFFVSPGEPLPDREIVARPRIGVAYSGIWATKPLRFYIKENPFVSTL